MKSIVRVCAGVLALAGVAQAQTGSIVGSVTDNTKKPLAGAVVQVIGTRIGTYAAQDGSYRIENVPVGPQRLVTRLPGYSGDTTIVTVAADQTATQNLTMRASTTTLAKVTVRASPRLAETKAAAIAEMKNADNIVYVESGDDIRSLPSLNAAEAAERIPGVTTERDEGEGKFVQIRGTEPKLQGVTIDGVHIPGTLNGDRSVKLDDIPSDVLGAIEVSKTLTADQDADAIGGSVNFVSKIPETAPRGYISGLFGYTTLRDGNAGQIGGTYGGRFGKDQKFGALLGVSYDRNDRPIDDIEPSWNSNALGTGFYPSSFDQRDYYYFRQRYGADADLDYRFDAHTSVYLRGLFGRFLDHGYREVWNVSANADSLAGATRPFIGTNGTSTRQSENRTPTENTYGGILGFKKDDLGPFRFDASAQLGGSSSISQDYRTSTYDFVGTNVSYQYNNKSVLQPKYRILDPVLQADLRNPNLFALSGYNSGSSRAVASEAGGAMNFLLPYALGDLPATLKFGGKFRNLTKTYDQNNVNSVANPLSPVTVAMELGSLTSDHFYQQGWYPGGINLGPFPSNDRTSNFENSHPGELTRNAGDVISNRLSEYFGNERVTAAYVMHTLDISRLHFNAGLRLENTYQEYRGWADTLASDYTSQAVAGAQKVIGRHTYNDLFPSAALKFAADENTNVRASLTRGIARPDYSALAPTINGTPTNQLTTPPASTYTLSLGNPHLKAETAWNYDFLVEHYLPASGVIDVGVFYKDLHDIVYTQRFQNYQGLIPSYRGQGYTMPLNGPSGHLIGWEADWEQHLTFLPGWLAGFGFDVNWTHVNSYQIILNSDGTINRRAPLFRTSPDIGNISGLYAYGPISARVAWVYQGPNIGAFGDGTSSAVTGDNYFYAHAQVDGTLYVNFSSATQLQLQLLNANDAVFGFFNGNTKHQFDLQREFYGQTLYFGLRQSF